MGHPIDAPRSEIGSASRDLGGGRINATEILAIAVGGAFGAVMRFLASTATYGWLGHDFPYGTLMVNLLGSLAMGFLFHMLVERLAVAVEWRAVLLVGFLGAFTTFSTFSVETLALIEEGRAVAALANAGASVLGCVGAAWLGLSIARYL
jgi:CrcB protein